MSTYLLVESRDPFECKDCIWFYETARLLESSGSNVFLFLIQNGVFPARVGSLFCRHLSVLCATGIKVFADHLSLQERSIAESQIIDEVQCSTMETLADLLVQPETKAIWH